MSVSFSNKIGGVFRKYSIVYCDPLGLATVRMSTNGRDGWSMIGFRDIEARRGIRP